MSLEEVRATDYNLSPSQFVEINGKVLHRSLSEILTDLEVAKKEREQADVELKMVLVKFGLNGEGKK